MLCAITSPMSSHSVNWSTLAARGLGHTRADMETPQAIEHPPHIALFARFDAVKEVARGLLPHAFKVGDLGQFKRVEVRHVLHQPFLHQLANEHLAATFDVYRAASAPMFEVPAKLDRKSTRLNS